MNVVVKIAGAAIVSIGPSSRIDNRRAGIVQLDRIRNHAKCVDLKISARLFDELYGVCAWGEVTCTIDHRLRRVGIGKFAKSTNQRAIDRDIKLTARVAL